MKIAIIGVGRMGRCHAQVVRNREWDLVGVCDQNLESLALTTKECGIPQERLFTDAGALLEQARPECVVVATTAPSHSHYTCMAAHAGVRYILCEKPMATSLAECDRMLAVCRQYQVKLAINHQMRFMEQYTEAKRIVTAETFGGLSSVAVVSGNFGMAMNGTHYFEMFRYVTDEQPVEVTAWFSKVRLPNPRGPQFDDPSGAVRLITASGKRFYMENSADQGHGIKVIYSGPYGQLVVDELAGKMYLSVRQEQYRDLPTTRYGMPWVEAEKKIEPASNASTSHAVLDALLNDRRPPSGEDGRLAAAILVAAYVSNENGHIPVRLDDGALPLERVFPWP